MPRETEDRIDAPGMREGDHAERRDLSPADRALLDDAAAQAAGADEDRQPGTLADDEDTRLDVSTVPMSEITGADADSGYGETEDGLDDTAEAVRSEAEDRPTGAPDTDYTG